MTCSTAVFAVEKQKAVAAAALPAWWTVDWPALLLVSLRAFAQVSEQALLLAFVQVFELVSELV
jgi:hypothetical protein